MSSRVRKPLVDQIPARMWRRYTAEQIAAARVIGLSRGLTPGGFADFHELLNIACYAAIEEKRPIYVSRCYCINHRGEYTAGENEPQDRRDYSDRIWIFRTDDYVTFIPDLK